ncbi:Hsp70 family protein [Corynebacterium amycolatum]|uniref:Hsp70 family protein n=1 Tax=Corynebacterium amycolatum TaxID=43765 RepID=UPI00124587FC|nr:Hsp70 family protein [Corynebacterium amycolatum]KAA9226524.1 Hsp70 family protein [Corynebacterium amycolatum]
MAERIYGIDLGTSNSAISYVDSLGVPVIQENLDGDLSTPSVVWFESKANTVVGKLAREEKLFSPNDVIELVKRSIGTDKKWNFSGKAYTPEEISSLILRSLVPDEAADDEISAVITVPAYFGAKEREATRNAGQIANFNVLELVAEPVAAALYYDSKQPLKDKTLLVYDLGGGTFDATIVQGIDNTFRVIATDGDARLGGADWDKALGEFILDKFIEQTGDEEAENDETFVAKLHEQTVNCKEALSNAESATVRLASDSGSRAKIAVTREDLERVTAPLLEQTEIPLTRVLETAKEKEPGLTIDEVILVGGSSRMTAVTKLVERLTGKKPLLVEPDLAVAKGAALAAMISKLGGVVNAESSPAVQQQSIAQIAAETGIDAGQLAALSEKKVANVLPKSIGIRVVDHLNNPYIDYLVNQNDMIPLSEPVVREYSTVADGQEEVDLTLYQQASDVPSEDVALNDIISGSESMLTGIPPLPKGQPIQVKFFVAADGMITVEGTHVPSGRSIESHVRIGVMNEDEISAARTTMMKVSVSQGDN